MEWKSVFYRIPYCFHETIAEKIKHRVKMQNYKSAISLGPCNKQTRSIREGKLIWFSRLLINYHIYLEVYIRPTRLVFTEYECLLTVTWRNTMKHAFRIRKIYPKEYHKSRNANRLGVNTKMTFCLKCKHVNDNMWPVATKWVVIEIEFWKWSQRGYSELYIHVYHFYS